VASYRRISSGRPHAPCGACQISRATVPRVRKAEIRKISRGWLARQKGARRQIPLRGEHNAWRGSKPSLECFAKSDPPNRVLRLPGDAEEDIGLSESRVVGLKPLEETVPTELFEPNIVARGKRAGGEAKENHVCATSRR
jgi:hypothetical protein